MTIPEAKEKQRLEMQSALSVIKTIIDVPGEHSGYRTPESKLQGIRERLTRLDKFNDNLFDSVPD